MLYHHKVPGGQAYVVVMDARTPGKGYDEFWRRSIEEEEAVYIRGMVSRLYQKGDKIVVKGCDLKALSGLMGESQLKREMAKELKELYDYEAGFEVIEKGPLTMFTDKDDQSFIK